MATLLGRYPRLLDVGIAATLVIGGLLEGVVTDVDRPLWVHLTLTVVVMSAVALRRLFPLGTLGFVVLGMMAVDPSGQLSIFAALVIVSFTAGLEVDPPRAYWGLLLATVPFYVGYSFREPLVSDYVAVTVLYGGSWAVGQMVRQRTQQAAEHAARADRAEREREERAARAVAEERARIARELHDIVAHSISVITVQTQAVRRRLDPGQQREIDDLRAVESTARQAMAEMRRLFGVLRAEGERPALSPQPGLDQLGRLIADTRAAGVEVSLAVEGPASPLPPGLDLAAYRVVQEALTNVRKHAPGGRVTVCVRHGGGGLDIAVEDTGGVPPGTADGAGLGLVGMRERVALYGGTVDAGPRPDGGFAVRVRLPFREGAAA
ncbi:signal transduction histidine kinase [Blastococcus colisei]|uniref:histidine kinase n=1 Tax=Blastococcus colisei TaxID=1564162 RepID=A0A543NZP3_9ACTN|nr:histidine kinase [Blastococcus colisei]TQN37321.1 signal transduction histidine kinase [Blastococcus colisei]